MTYFSLEFLTKAISAFIASLGFVIILKENKRHILISGICAMCTYIIYYTVMYFMDSVFAAALISSAFTALFSEILARIQKAPTLVFIITGVIPTVPGGDLYRTMRCLILSDFNGALENLLITLEIGLGIAGGIAAMSMLFSVIMNLIKSQMLVKNTKNQHQ